MKIKKNQRTYNHEAHHSADGDAAERIVACITRIGAVRAIEVKAFWEELPTKQKRERGGGGRRESFFALERSVPYRFHHEYLLRSYCADEATLKKNKKTKKLRTERERRRAPASGLCPYLVDLTDFSHNCFVEYEFKHHRVESHLVRRPARSCIQRKRLFHFLKPMRQTITVENTYHERRNSFFLPCW